MQNVKICGLFSDMRDYVIGSYVDITTGRYASFRVLKTLSDSVKYRHHITIIIATTDR